ncbi:hypothetical protein [Vibrio sp. LaRot3]|uniref:hypothetical protein n=1 Tax=Vibrio sp. LaRot3 TaxID=2998829 RepID=UPI0022CE2EA1|nr:hypothetical protein [Vibrio sp. LaRot3]MDA0150175.1 hypothetical protein [Vibrio sp. LaRot3]
MLVQTMRLGLLLLFGCHGAFAAEAELTNNSFQRYFAQTRACLSSSNYAQCLPNYLQDTIRRPADNVTQQAFIQQLQVKPELRKQFKDCFSIEAQVALRSTNHIVFVNKQMACSATRIDERWLLEQFYHFYAD